MRKSISIFSYGLNEKKNIRRFIRWSTKFAKNFSNDFEIIFIDDGSTDKSYETLIELKKKNKKIKIYKNNKNMGTAYCFKRGLKLAKKNFILNQMADLCYNVNNFKKYKKDLFNKKIDFLHGYRKNFLFRRSDNFYKSLVSTCNYILIGCLYGFKTRDFQNSYLVNKKLLKNINLYSKTSFVNAELFLKLYKKNVIFKEVEVTFKKRLHGVSKGTSFSRIIESIFEIIKFKIYYKKFFLN